MDSRQLKILELLKENGVGVPTDISPLLTTMFPYVDRMDGFETRWTASIIHKILEDMKGDGLIDVQTYVSLGSGNDTNGYTWLDVVHINASLKNKGSDKLDEELNKTANEKLMDSIIESNQSHIETNKSVKETNEATKRLYDQVLPDAFKSQDKSSNMALGLAFISVIFIAITAYLQYRSKTDKELQGLKQEVKETRQVLQDMKSSLEKIGSSTKPRDTIYVKVKTN